MVNMLIWAENNNCHPLSKVFLINRAELRVYIRNKLDPTLCMDE